MKERLKMTDITVKDLKKYLERFSDDEKIEIEIECRVYDDSVYGPNLNSRSISFNDISIKDCDGKKTLIIDIGGVS